MHRVTLKSGADEKTVYARDGESLLELLRRSGSDISAPCGGNGRCGGCLVLIDGSPALACRKRVSGDMLVTIPTGDTVPADSRLNDLPPNSGDGLGLAVDVGTTTVAIALFGLKSGAFLGSATELNSQRSYGADVVSRITRCMVPGGLDAQQKTITAQIEKMARRLCADALMSADQISRVSIAGNTVMEHILAGLSPESIGAYPFTPLSLFGSETAAGDVFSGFSDSCKLYLCPAVSGYVGGDVCAGLLSTGAYLAEETTLFIDVGTNGEMALCGKDGILCCSAAAGPAFEGAELECGINARPGAIAHVNVDGGVIHCQTVGGAPAVGLCGSGVIDALAALLELGAVDAGGRLLPSDEAPLSLSGCYGEEGEFYLADGVYLSQQDIRKLQLAKAAIRAGTDALLRSACVDEGEVAKYILAGGFGSYINVQNACRIGLLPMSAAGRTVSSGNSSLSGAALALLPDNRTVLARISRSCKTVELSMSKEFSEDFIARMWF